MENKVRILIAEDHATVREGVKLLVNAQADMEVVGEADNGDAAVSETVRLTPDIVIMDISMPGVNGLRATKKLRNMFPAIKILMLTRHSDDGYLQQLISAIPSATDQKSILELQARIAAEQAMLQNENTKLMVFYHAAQAQELNRDQQARELSIANHGSLRALPPIGLNR